MRQHDKEAIAKIMAIYGTRLQAIEAQQRAISEVVGKQGVLLRELGQHFTALLDELASRCPTQCRRKSGVRQMNPEMLAFVRELVEPLMTRIEALEAQADEQSKELSGLKLRAALVVAGARKSAGKPRLTRAGVAGDTVVGDA